MMRFLGVLVLLILVVIAFGMYRGWFIAESTSTGDKTRVTFTVDQEKFKADEKRVLDKLPGSGTTPAPAPAEKVKE